jgi:hypothetical protein
MNHKKHTLRKASLTEPHRLHSALGRLINATRTAISTVPEDQVELDRARTWARWIHKGASPKARASRGKPRPWAAANMRKINAERKAKREAAGNDFMPIC